MTGTENHAGIRRGGGMKMIRVKKFSNKNENNIGKISTEKNHTYKEKEGGPSL